MNRTPYIPVEPVAERRHGVQARFITTCVAMVAAYGVLIVRLDPALPGPLPFTSVEPWSMLALNLLPDGAPDLAFRDARGEVRAALTVLDEPSFSLKARDGRVLWKAP